MQLPTTLITCDVDQFYRVTKITQQQKHKDHLNLVHIAFTFIPNELLNMRSVEYCYLGFPSDKLSSILDKIPYKKRKTTRPILKKDLIPGRKNQC